MPDHRVRPVLVQAVVVVVAVVLGQVEAWTIDPAGAPRVLIALCVLLATAALALVPFSADVAAILVVGALVTKDFARGPGEVLSLLVCGIITAFAVGLLLPALRARVTLAALVALAALGVLIGPEDAAEAVFSVIALGAPWVAGRLVRASREHARVLQELIALREEEVREREQRTVAEERSAIAREIHDLVGHSVSLMVLQAGAAEEVLAERPEQARAALEAIQRTGRVAVEDLHQVLGLLRADTAAATAPVPGLDQLGALVASIVGTGQRVDYRVEGEVRDLPPALSLAAYRIIQEALTNVVRHAGRARADVLVERRTDQLRLLVSDDGDGLSTAPASGGHGLVGIRERVALYDGELVCGPLRSGGFGVEARFPLAVRA